MPRDANEISMKFLVVHVVPGPRYDVVLHLPLGVVLDLAVLNGVYTPLLIPHLEHPRSEQAWSTRVFSGEVTSTHSITGVGLLSGV